MPASGACQYSVIRRGTVVTCEVSPVTHRLAYRWGDTFVCTDCARSVMRANTERSKHNAALAIQFRGRALTAGEQSLFAPLTTIWKLASIPA